MNLRSLAIILCGVTALTSCIGTDIVDDLTESEPRLELVGSNISTIDTIEVGSSITYGATYFDNTSQETDATFEWLSATPAIATVDGNGVATGVSGGTTTITVSANGLSSERLLLVRQLERIEVTGTNTGVLIGETMQLSATYFNPSGVATLTTISWTSSNPAIASVDATGLVTGVTAGQVAISASANGVTSTEKLVTVVASVNEVAQVTISTTSSSIMEGTTLQYTATALNVNGDVLTGQTFNWQSSNASVASIDANGLATGITTGTSQISVSADGVSSDQLELLVTPAMITSRMGTFQGSGSYTVNGTITLETLQDGTVQLSFGSGFTSSTGPGLYVYLSNSTTGGIALAPLPSQSGPFTMNAPAGTGINDFNYVLIWCQPFGVTFGSAQLN